MRFEPEEGTWTQRERVALCSAVGLGSEAMAVPKAPSPGWAPQGEAEVTAATEPRRRCLEQEGWGVRNRPGLLWILSLVPVTLPSAASSD